MEPYKSWASSSDNIKRLMHHSLLVQSSITYNFTLNCTGNNTTSRKLSYLMLIKCFYCQKNTLLAFIVIFTMFSYFLCFFPHLTGVQWVLQWTGRFGGLWAEGIQGFHKVMCRSLNPWIHFFRVRWNLH